MLERCRNPRHIRYRYYGGRGIKVCKRWHSFANFLKDMGERPPGKTLDRRDVDGHYCKRNCRWATRGEQSLNQRHGNPYVYTGAADRVVCGCGVDGSECVLHAGEPQVPF